MDKLVSSHLPSKPLVDALRKQLATHVAALPQPPKLVVVMVGENPASAVYVRNKEKAAQAVGMTTDTLHLPAETSAAQLHQTLDTLSADPYVNGILLQLPLPAHIDAQTALEHIKPVKDVDGLTLTNVARLEIGDSTGVLPCTPLGVMRLLAHAGVDLDGIHAVMVGRSNLVGRPMASLLSLAGATVTSCHRQTRDLPYFTRQADVLVVATGNKGLIRCQDIKAGAVVIDVGINTIPGLKNRIVGDCDFENCANVARYITPVPGGVGPMTVTSLLTNTVDATRKQLGMDAVTWEIPAANAL